MITELKKSWKLLKYTYQFKTNMALALFFVVLGVIWFGIDGVSGLHLAAMYVYLGPVMLVQLTYNLLFANLVASSAKKKVLERAFPNVISIVSGLISFAFAVIYMIVYSNAHPTDEMSGGNMLIVVGLVMAVTIIYYSVAFKIFVVSTILFGVCFALTYFFGMAFAVYIVEKMSILLLFRIQLDN